MLQTAENKLIFVKSRQKMDIARIQEIKTTLRENTVFSTLEPAHLEIAAQKSVLISAEKGKLLFIQGENANSFYIVKSGQIKIFNENADGHQAVIEIAAAGDFVGESALFNNRVYPHCAEILEDAQVLRLPMALLKLQIDNIPAFAFAMMNFLAAKRRAQDMEIEHRSLQSAPQRIGCFLLKHYKKPLLEIGTAITTIRLPYDKSVIASELGMQPETFSRALNRLRDETGLVVKGSVIETDSLDRLIRYSCAACSAEFPCKDR